MLQIEVVGFGGPEVMRVAEVPDPVPGPGEVVLRVHVTGVLGLDVAIRYGGGGPFAVSPPYVPGQGAAGVVVEVGAGVEERWIGTRVVTDVVGGGAYAEKLLAPVGGLVPIPDGVDDQSAAALMNDGRTAINLLRVTPVCPGQTALVLPAAGGLGSLLVQMLASRGVHVIGAARRAEKLAAVRALGAERVADYASPDWVEGLADIDVVFDGVGGPIGRQAGELLAVGGRFSSYGLASGEVTTLDPGVVRARRIVIADMGQLHLSPEEHLRHIRDILAAAARGEVHPVIGRVDPLVRAAEAHAAFENRQITGKALLLVSG